MSYKDYTWLEKKIQQIIIVYKRVSIIYVKYIYCDVLYCKLYFLYYNICSESSHVGNVVAMYTLGCGQDRLHAYTNMYCAAYVLCLQGTCPVKVKGGIASQLHLPSLHLAGCGRLQLRVQHWATSVALLQVVDNWPHKQEISMATNYGNRRFYLYLH